MGSTTSEGRILTRVLDELAVTNPDSLYCIHPVSNESKLEWNQITVENFAWAVNRLAWWIDEKLDGQKGQQVLAYIGANDLRYGAFMLACMKTGHAALLLSTRNSQSAQRHLLEATKCSIIVDGAEKAQLQHALDELVTSCTDIPLERWQIGSMWDVFSSVPVALYPHRVSFANVEDLPAIIIHSSGTTGNPKPVVLTHGYLATLDNMQHLPLPPGRENALCAVRRRGEMRFFYSPMFHFMGLICITEGLLFQTPFLFAPDRPLTANLFHQIMSSSHMPIWGVFTPSTLDELVSSEEGLQALAKLTAINFGGAPMAQATGQKLTSLFGLQTIIGSSETSYTPALLCEDPADWNYMEWVPAFDLRMENVGDGLSELILLRSSTRQYHGIFHSHPHLKEYRTGDLFRPHPSKPGLWRYDGRGDDIIVLRNGEKFNPIEAEKLIEAHPLVKLAAIFGQDRFQATLLIQPNWDQLPPSWTSRSLKETIRSTVDKANSSLPGHGKIFQSHIAFTSRDKPFALSPKGTLRRRDVSKDYADVLEDLYSLRETFNEPEKKNQVKEFPGESLSEIQQWIEEQVAQILSRDITDHEDDIISLGMDSLQVVRLSQVLQNAEHKMPGVRHPKQWTNAMIYDLASIPELAQALYQRIDSDELHTPPESIEGTTWSREDTLIRLIWQQAQFLGSGGLTIALTGSTGELGSYILNALLQDPSIKQVYCLNRSTDAAERQVTSFETKGLSTAWLTETSRVQFWQSDLQEENLGLTPDKYKLLEENIDVFIHNAWSVNFNQPIVKFESQIVGLRRLLTLIEHSAHNADFHFVSSVSAVAALSVPPDTVILEKLYGSAGALRQGYGESKFVGEQLCGLASQRNGSRISIHRVGQLGGPSTPGAGMWNPRDWIPSLVRSSQTMHKLPDSLGSFQVDWLPIDSAALIMTEIVKIRREEPHSELTVYHIMNPRATEWKSLAGVVAKACNASIVSLAEWVQELELAASERKDLHEIPAAGLLEFFRMLVAQQNHPKPRMSVGNTQKGSATSSAVQPVSEQLMELWLRQWKAWIPELAI
ncbi:NRPS-like enzyme [Penicillium verhagenii]|uniref:NRPS-like enzyme n=1 Tax=Penicillium verhagenii TaxID=1562060 RepID=UPI0025451AB6|nr:NRPS-like enzyme [Penicillium verhagenii]KAJ5935211.1 NRPS-like enzyme [Penicillium verhagenii]